MSTKIEIHESRRLIVGDFLEIEIVESFANTWHLSINFNCQENAVLRLRLMNGKYIDYLDLIKLIGGNNETSSLERNQRNT